MKLVTFLAEGKELVGVRSEDGRYYYPISALGLNYRDMNELVDCITDTERGRCCGCGEWLCRKVFQWGGKALRADSDSKAGSDLPG